MEFGSAEPTNLLPSADEATLDHNLNGASAWVQVVPRFVEMKIQPAPYALTTSMPAVATSLFPFAEEAADPQNT